MNITRALLALSLTGLVGLAQAAPWSVGLERISLTDPVDHRPMQALAFYPSDAASATTLLEGYRIDAGEGLPVAKGHFALLMVSHGNSGSPLALHDLATALASQGFIVVAVTHPGDNVHDHSRLGAISNVYGRPLQVSAAISATLQDPLLGPALDRGKVGVIGYSAGGETALILAGARPDLERLREYCQQHPQDGDACKTHGVLVADRSELRPQADARVGAVMLMAPLSLMFGRHALASVHVPALIYSGDNDQLLLLERNADALARKLPLTPDYRLLAGAGHFVFMAPCDHEQHQRLGVLCKDADGVDRRDIHRTLQSEAGAFFNQSLASDSRQLVHAGHAAVPDHLEMSALHN